MHTWQNKKAWCSNNGENKELGRNKNKNITEEIELLKLELKFMKRYQKYIKHPNYY